MRFSLAHHAGFRALAAPVVVFSAGHELLACSGPHAAQHIRESEQIGWLLAGVSIAVVAGGCTIARCRGLRGRIRWMLVPLVLHPRLWMDSFHGDCGYGLRAWSLIAVLGISAEVALVLCWPRRDEAKPRQWKWATSGALAGTLAGGLIANAVLEQSFSTSTRTVPLAVSALCGSVIAGALASAAFFQIRTRGAQRSRILVGTLLLLPGALASVVAVLLPVVPYEVSSSMSWPTTFVVVDDATGRPVPNATVRFVDPRFRLDDPINQPAREVTGADGSADLFPSANIHGRQGLLGMTEMTSYNPWLIRVEATGYRPFISSLAGDPAIPAAQLIARPLSLPFPPPKWVTIRLKPASPVTQGDVLAQCPDDGMCRLELSKEVQAGGSKCQGP